MSSGIVGSTVTKYSLGKTILAGLCIILAAVYTLNMLRKVLYGETAPAAIAGTDIRFAEKLALGILVILIFWMGIYPQTMLNVANDFSDMILNKANVLPLLKGK